MEVRKTNKELYNEYKMNSHTASSNVKSSGTQRLSNRDLYFQYKAPSVMKDLQTRLSEWMKRSDDFVSGYNERYADQSEKYRSDSSQWLADVSKNKNYFDNEADEIKSVLGNYQKFFDPDTYKNITSAMDEYRKVQSDIYNNSLKDNQYWSRWDSEDSYNRYKFYNDATKGSYEKLLSYSRGEGDGPASPDDLENLKALLNSKSPDDVSEYYKVLDSVVSRTQHDEKENGWGDFSVDNSDIVERDNQRRKEELDAKANKGLTEIAQQHPVAASAISSLMSPSVSLEGAIKSINGLMGAKNKLPSAAPNVPDYDFNTVTNAQSAIRGGVASEIGSPVGKYLYQVGMSMADNLVARSFGGGVNQLIQSGSAASHTYNDAKASGATDAEAGFLGLLAGGIEAITEHAQFDRLTKNINSLGKTGIKNGMKNFIKSAIPEAGEEIISEIANQTADYFVLGNKSGWAETYNQAIENGASEGEARAEVFLKFAKDVGLSGLGGLISGGAFGTGATIINNTNASRVGSTLVDNKKSGDLIQTVLDNADPNSEIYKYALEVSPNSKSQVGRLAQLAASDSSLAPLVDSVYSNILNTNTDVKTRNDSEVKSSIASTPNNSESVINIQTKTGLIQEDVGEIDPAIIPAVFESTKDFSENGARGYLTLAKTINQEQLSDFDVAFRDGYTIGLTGMKYDDPRISKVLDMANSEEDRRIVLRAVEAGNLDRIAAEKSDLSNNVVLNGKGAVTVENGAKIDKSNLDILNLVSDKIGIDIVVSKTIDNGIANGKYEDGKIYIASDSDNPVMTVLKHELTHHLQTVAPKEYYKYRDFLLSEIASKDKSRLDLISTGMNEDYQQVGKNIKLNDVYDEIAADASELFFTDSKSIQKFINQNRSLGEKIRDFLKDLSAKIKSILRVGELSTDTAKAIHEYSDLIDKAQKLWADALDSAKSNQVDSNLKQDIDKSHMEKNHSTKYSMRDYSGNELSEEQQEFFKNSAVRLDEDGDYWYGTGALVPVYHATFDDFYTFEKDHLGKFTDENANDFVAATAHVGFFFNTQDLTKTTDGYKEGRAIKAYLNITHPYIVSSLDQFTDEIWNVTYDELNGEVDYEDMPEHVSPAEAGERFSDWLLEEGYDGIMYYDEEFGGISFVALYPSQIKSVNNKKPTQNSDIRYSLKKYTEHQKENWKNSNRIVLYENKAQLEQFIDDAINKKNLGKKMYFGIIPDDLADRVRSELGIDIKDYNCTLRASEVLKIFTSHGITQSEESRGQRAITTEDLFNIPEVIQSPDIILDGGMYENKPTIRFIKDINGKTTVVTYVSNKHKDLTVQTMYARKKRSLATAADVKSPALTSETIVGTASDKSISNIRKKSNMSKDSLKTKDRNLSWEELIEKYGSYKKGENASRDISVPKQTSDEKNVMRGVRTILESNSIPDDMVEDIKESVLSDAMSYSPISDKAAQNFAEETYNGYKGYEGSLERWRERLNSKTGMNKNLLAFGEKLLMEAGKRGDVQQVVQLTAEIAAEATRAGQTVQAMRMLKKMSGAAQAVSVKKSIDTMQKDLDEQFEKNPGKGRITINVDESLYADLVGAKNTKEIDTAVEKIYKQVAEQLPTTWYDKWNAWRYLAMLGNPRTHLRNLIGNAVFMPAVKLKNIIKTGTETAAVNLKLLDASKKTSAIKVDKKYKDFARADYEDIQAVIASGGKYTPADIIRDNKTVFKTKVLEKARKTNSNLLEIEDGLFLKKHYIDSLSQFMQARNIDINDASADVQKVLEEGRNYAIEEAQKATYRDASKLANAINRLSKTNMAANVLIEHALPFKKTPINVLKRGVEYSPVGLIRTISDGLIKLKRGKIDATEWIDQFASGLSGTLITGLGYFLSSLGLLTRKIGDDKEDQFDKMTGEQEYAINIDGKSYTIDWLAPVSLPLFVGAEIETYLSGGGQDLKGDPLGTLLSIADPMFNLSMLDGVNNIISTARYSDNPASAIVANIPTSYLSQGIPTLFGQVARTIDGTRRTTYSEYTGFSKSLDSSLQKNLNKIPGLSFLGAEYIDQWGRTDTEDNVAMRIFENFISPGYYSEKQYSDVEKDLSKIFQDTGESAVLPSYAKNYFTLDGETYRMTQEEYNTFAKMKGQTSYNLLDSLVGKSVYKRLDSATKAKIVQGVYDYATQKAKAEVSSYSPEKMVENADSLKRKYGIPVELFILAYKYNGSIESDKDSKGKTISGSKKEKAINFVDDLPLTSKQKKAVIDTLYD